MPSNVRRVAFMEGVRGWDFTLLEACVALEGARKDFKCKAETSYGHKRVVQHDANIKRSGQDL